jgi:hypothetical protein
MPIDAVGEVVVAALEAVGEVVLTEPPKRGRWRRYVYWTFVLLGVGLLAFGAYLALS